MSHNHFICRNLSTLSSSCIFQGKTAIETDWAIDCLNQLVLKANSVIVSTRTQRGKIGNFTNNGLMILLKPSKLTQSIDELFSDALRGKLFINELIEIFIQSYNNDLLHSFITQPPLDTLPSTDLVVTDFQVFYLFFNFILYFVD